jgi:alpha-L-rhamnosidase
VDWPAAERDGFEFREVNTVVNAFHLRALSLMAELASALGREEESRQYRERWTAGRRVFREKLFDANRGLFRDGVGTGHVSLHANLFPLAFGLAPEGAERTIAQWLQQRGMACSVYAAQYLLEALFTHGSADQALGLMLAEGDRSWRHMVESGTTITWEAWDQRYKPNQDWNHAWGAAPANLLPRFVLGVSPAQPGWSEARIRPVAGKRLEWCEGTVPTPRGGITVFWRHGDGFELKLNLPPGMTARVEIPVSGEHERVFVDDRSVAVERAGDYWRVLGPVTGSSRITARP